MRLACRFHVSVSVFQISCRCRVGCPSFVSAGSPNTTRFRRSQDWMTDLLLSRHLRNPDRMLVTPFWQTGWKAQVADKDDRHRMSEPTACCCRFSRV
jgi:hypothetical protein